MAKDTPVKIRSPRSGYLPSLDGWRALAIGAVFMDHDEPWVFRGHSNARFHEYGGLGLYLFFALSGVLVCTRILEDESMLGEFRIGAFYIRRLLRIQPAALVYLATIAALDLLRVTHERPSALLGGALLYQNYLYHPLDTSWRWVLTGHFWTLSVEEHFYLLLSLVLFLCRRNRVLIFSCIWSALALWPLLASQLHLYGPDASLRASELQLQYLFGPALLALLLRRKQILDFCFVYLRPWVAISGVLVIKSVWFLQFRAPITYHPGWIDWLLDAPCILLYGFSLWVVSTMLHPRSWTTRLLEIAPLRFLGRLSYSLYLWHVLFLLPLHHETGVTTPWFLFLLQQPWRYVCILVAALLSYFFVEKPMIRLGHHLAPPATPGHRDLAVDTPRQQALVP